MSHEDILGLPTLEPYGMGYKITWDDGVEITMDSLNTKSDFNVEAEIVIKDKQQLSQHLMGPIRTAITKAMSTLIRELEKDAEGRNWSGRLKQATYHVLEEYRKGEPIMKLDKKSAPDRPPERITGIAYEGMPTLIYGDGGMGKSTLAVALGTLVQAGQPLGQSFNVVKGNVLVLDYEASWEETWRRSNDVVAGMALDRQAMVHYRFCSAPLASEVEHLRAEIRAKDIDMVIVDSAGPACGGEPENAQACLQYFSALRSLGTTEHPITTITLAHITKSGGSKSGPFGSVYWTNLPRTTFELKKAQKRGENYIDTALHHRKTNIGVLREPVGLRMTWNNGITLEAFNVTDHAVLAEDLGYGERAYRVLEKELKSMSVKDIAEYLGIDNSQTEKLAQKLATDDRFEQDTDGNWAINANLRF